MNFYFKAKKNSGETITGVRDAQDRFSLARELKMEGSFLISAELAKNQSRFSWQKLNNLFGRISLREKIIFASNLSAMISAGLSLSRSLSVMQRQSTNKYLSLILKSISEKVEQGESLSSALSAYPDSFPEVFVAMVASGEESGSLPEALKVVSDQMTKSYDLRRKIRGAMIYPIIIVGVIIAIAILMMIFLVPTLTQTFSELDVELPFSTRVIIWLSDTLTNHLLFLSLCFFSLGLLLFYGLRTDGGKRVWYSLVLKLPLIGKLAREVNSAIIMRTLASLITSGVSMVDSLKITERILQNYYYKTVMNGAVLQVQKGIGLARVFQSESYLFPVLVGEMAEVGEETGNLPKMLLNGAKFFEEEVDQATKNLSTIIEPLLMVLIGLAVGFFAISMIGPIYSLNEVI